MFFKIENNIIKEVVSAHCQTLTGYEKVSSQHQGGEGDDVRMFDAEGKKRPTPELLKEGFFCPKPEEKLLAPHEERGEGNLIEELPDGWKLVEKTREERVLSGVEDPSPTEKILDGKIVPKSTEEQYKEGLLSKEEYTETLRREEISQAFQTLRETEPAVQMARDLEKELPSPIKKKRIQAWHKLKTLNALPF